jgi:hypothetical protein
MYRKFLLLLPLCKKVKISVAFIGTPENLIEDESQNKSNKSMLPGI